MSKIGRRKVAGLALIPFITAACGGGGSDTPATSLPEINVQPADQEISSGDPVSFSVEVKTSTDVKFQWKKNGVNIGENVGGQVANGSTTVTSSITLNDLIASDSGSTFSVTVTNVAGSVESRAATVTVYSPNIEIIESSPLFSVVNFDSKGGSFAIDTNQTTRERHLVRLNSAGTKVNLTAGLDKHAILSTHSVKISAIDYKDESIYITESYYHSHGINVEAIEGGKITKISSDGNSTVVYESPTISPRGLVVDDTGNIFTIDSAANDLYKLTPAGEFTRISNLGIVPIGYYTFFREITLARTEDGRLFSCIFSPQLTNVVKIDSAGATTIIDKYDGNEINGHRYRPAAIGTHKNDLYTIGQDVTASENQVIKRTDAAGNSVFIAGTPGTNDTMTAGPLPGVIKQTQFIDIAKDGKIYLRSVLFSSTNVVVISPPKR